MTRISVEPSHNERWQPPRISSASEQTGQMAQAFKRAAADHAHIAQRAYELYEQRGRQDGWDLEDWLKAEQELGGALHHA